MKFDTVKLDRSLISGIPANPISHTLVRDIVQICRNFHMDCIAEGVETAEQVAALLDMGCTCAQGFYYDKPCRWRNLNRNTCGSGSRGSEDRTQGGTSMNNTAERPAQNAQSISKEPLIIGIGASAGGLEALQQFF